MSDQTTLMEQLREAEAQRDRYREMVGKVLDILCTRITLREPVDEAEQVDLGAIAQFVKAVGAEFLALRVQERDAAQAVAASLRRTNTGLNRRCQRAESAALQNVEECRRQGISLGRSLANFGYSRAERRAEELSSELQAARDQLRRKGEEVSDLEGRLRSALDLAETMQAMLKRKS